MGVFVFVELQGRGDCFDDFAGRAGDPGTFETHALVHADAVM